MRLQSLLILITCLFCLAGCTSEAGEAPAKSGRTYPYRVVATVGMVGDVVQNVAGDKAAVEALIGAGVDPHLYAPTRDDLAALFGADVVFYSGLMLEGKLGDTLTKLGEKKPCYALTSKIPEAYLQTDSGSGHHDPHVWMDVSGWKLATERAVEALSEFDPANAELYRTNGTAYLAKLTTLDEYAKKSFATIPKERRVLVTAHDAFQYLGRAYGIEVRGIQGISTESEAGLRDLNALVAMLVERKIAAVFVESSVAPKNVQALVEGAAAKGHKVTIGGELFSDAMGKKGSYEGTYIGMIDHNVTTIVHALGGEAPERGMSGQLAVHAK